jgi:hypothetical protein
MPHEARINEALKQLGEEHRLGMIALADYRARRREVMQSWGEKDATTSPGGARKGDAETARHVPTGPRAPAPAPGAGTGTGSGSGRKLAIGVVVLAAGAVAAYFVVTKALRREVPRQAQSAAPAPAPVSPQVLAIKRAADRFLADNTWDAAAVDAFLSQWRALDDRERERAREEPSLKTLRYQLQQNLEAERQLVKPDSAPEERARLELLERFAAELGQ